MVIHISEVGFEDGYEAVLSRTEREKLLERQVLDKAGRALEKFFFISHKENAAYAMIHTITPEEFSLLNAFIHGTMDAHDCRKKLRQLNNVEEPEL